MSACLLYSLIHASVNMSIHTPCMRVCLWFYLPICLSACPSDCLHVCLHQSAWIRRIYDNSRHHSCGSEGKNMQRRSSGLRSKQPSARGRSLFIQSLIRPALPPPPTHSPKLPH